MKKQNVKRFLAAILTIGVVATTVFPGTAYAAEVGEQISDVVESQPEDIEDVEAQPDTNPDVEENVPTVGTNLLPEDKMKDDEEKGAAEKENPETDPVEDDKDQTDSEVKPAGDSNILLLSSETVPEDTLGAVAVEQLAGAVRLTYESAEMSKNAFDVFTAMGIACEYDTQVEMLDKEPEKVEELNPAETPTEDVAVVEELKEEPVAVESASKEKSVKVAVIDTGCDLNVISGRIADGTDMSVTDVNGHGTLMTEIIASQTTEKVKILPIKAFDDNGYSTVGQVYDAIMRAIDLGADVINLSMSGVGSSQMLTHAINKATEKGIIVVVSAGNDASDVEGFMPGNIDSAITVSATDRNEVFAEYSNFGEKLDYSAVGEIIKDQGTEDTSDDVYYNGTSIAAAFVSSYAACIKDNNPEADVIGTFDKYAKDLGEAGRDAYYGKGFLSIENIAFDVDKSGDAKEDITNSDKEEDKQENNKTEEEDAKQVLRTNYSCNGTSCTHNQETVSESTMVYDSCHSDGYFPAAVQNDTTYSYTKAQLRQNGWNRYIVCDSQYSVETLANNSYNKKVKVSEASASSLKRILASNESAIIYLGCDVEITDTMIVNGNKILNGNGHTIRMNINNGFYWGKGNPPSAIKVTSTYFRLINTRIMGEADEYFYGYAKAFTGVDVQTGTAEFYNCAMAHHGNAVTSNAGTVVRAYGGKYYHNKANGFSTAGQCELYGVACYNNVQLNKNTWGGGGYSGSYPDLSYPGNHQNAGVSAHSTLITDAWSGYGQYRNCEFLRNGKNGIYIARDVPSGCTIRIQNTVTDSNGTEDADGSGITFGSRSDTVYIPCTISGVASRSNANCGIIYQYKNNNGGLTVQNAACYYNKVGLRVKGLYASAVGGDFSANSSHGLNCADNGSLTINGSVAHSNGAHGILHESGTLTISNAYAGSYHNGYGWVDAGNTYSGVCVKSGTAYIDGGTYLYNKTGLECQGGTMNVRSSGTIDVSSNDGNGILAKTGGNVIVDANALVNSHSNGSAAIYAENKAKVTVGAGEYYNSPNGIKVADGGVTTLSGGSVYNNTNGISNAGTVTLSGGDVYGNKTYGVYNNGTFTMSGGKVRDNDSNGTAVGGSKVQGIYNKSGIVNISGGQLSGNSDGLYNLSTANVTGGTIKGNENGIRNNTDPTTGLSGTTTINGTNVNITGNIRGIQNTADENGVKVIKATITKNTTADLSQSGKMFTISGANTKADTIELGVNGKGECEVVTLDGVPTEMKTIKFKSQSDLYDQYQDMTKAKEYAKMNISIGRPMFKCINTTPKTVLDSGKLVFTDDEQITLVKDKEEKAIMRPFKGSNMNESLAGGNIAEKDKYIVLSTKYAANYKVAEAVEGIKFILPDPEDIFWNEENAITLKPLKAIINGVEQVFDIAGWLKDGIGDAIEVAKQMIFGVAESDRDHELIAQLGMCNLVVSGNGQSAGEDYVIEKFNCAEDKLPQNTFEKEFLDDYYYIELGEQKRHETKYTYQGWSLSDDATYQDEGVMQPQGKLDYADVLTYIDSHKDSITYGDNGLPNIPIYVVWDKYPELEAKEICFSEMELDQSLNLSEEESVYLDDKGFASVLYERVVGTDDEDGALTNGAEEKGVICEDPIQDLRAELLSFEHTGATTVTFKATDGVGNVTERRVRVWINRGNPIEEAYINRARVINRKYYDIGKEYADKLVEDNKNRPENEKIGSYEINVARMLLTGKLDRSDAGDVYIEAHKDENPALYYMTGFNHGGLMPIDMWYTDPEYRKCIEEAFDNRENDTPEYSWKFTHEQVLETQEYVETYGISTSEHQDALWNYFNKYKSSFKKLK